MRPACSSQVPLRAGHWIAGPSEESESWDAHRWALFGRCRMENRWLAQGAMHQYGERFQGRHSLPEECDRGTSERLTPRG